jgi:ATP-dependent DNA helicase RecG
MRDQMLNHGLDQPLLGTDTGYFQVTFPGPGENLDRIRVPEVRLAVTPAIEAQLNERQKKMMLEVQKRGTVTSGWCRKAFDVVLLTVQRDLAALIDLGLIERKGKGRSARYVPKHKP